MRCFVTGATGHVGSALVRHLLTTGHEVSALTMPDDPWACAAFNGHGIRVVTGDILDRTSFPSEAFDWVFHLVANQSFSRCDRDYQWAVNVDGVANVLDWLAHHPPERFIHVSSLAAVGLGERPDQLMDETNSFDAHELGLMYATSKQAGERLVVEAASHGLPAVVANPGAVIGPWDRSGHVWRMLRRFVGGCIRVVPQGGINIVDGRDVACGLVAMATRAQRGERYLLTGHNVTYAELAAHVGRVVGVTGPIVAVPGWFTSSVACMAEPLATLAGRATLVARDEAIVGGRYLYFDAAKACRDLGFSVRPLDASLVDTVAWYDQIGLLQPSATRSSH